MPEDLSFFKQGREWLVTSSHENECYIFAEEEAEIEKVLSINGLKAKLEV